MAHATTPSLGAQDYFTTTLTGNVGASDTVINLANVPTATEGYLVIDPNNLTTREIIYYTSKGASTVTTPDASSNSGRGVGGTSVQTHTTGTLVELREVAEYWNALQNGQSLATGSVTNAKLSTDISPAKFTNPYKFRVTRNAAANSGAGVFAVIAFDTKQYDTGTNVSAGVFTAPVAGFYQFNWRSAETTSGAETFITSLFKNGVEASRGGHATLTSLVLSSEGSDCVQLAANDTVDIRSFGTAARALLTGDTLSTYFSGFLVSAL